MAKRKKLTKKQVAFAVSAFASVIAAVSLFISDFAKQTAEHLPNVIEEDLEMSNIEQAGELIHAVGEALGGADIPSAGGNGGSGGFDPETLNNISTSGKIVRVVDGDTYCIDLEDVKGDEEKGTKVRIIGVDTPESVAPDTYRKDNTEEGKTVSDVVKDKLKVGDTVFIEYDVQQQDRYGRTLAYVYFADGTMVEDWLLTEGLANVATYPPNVKYSERFVELAHTAWENKVGLWKDFYTDEPTK